ncbi:MAG: hypothetical protein SFW66_07465 [Gammaproteobacteria bacterium]|nr:hypothetical protein [Gammaproteobacteria bacterium]
MTKKEPIQRTCTGCGLLKPLAAFLYLTDKGTTYGTLCATCRSIQARNPKKAEDEDASRRTTSFRIGAQEKVQIEKSQKSLFEKKTEDHLHDVKKREGIFTTKSERESQAKVEEKKHLTEYVFLKSTRAKSTPDSQEKKPTQAISETVTVREKAQLQKQEKEDKDRKENKLTEGASFFLDAPQTGLVSRNNEVIRRFFDLVGASSPAAKKRALEQLLQKQNAQKAPGKEDKINAEEIIKEMDNQFGPKSKR